MGGLKRKLKQLVFGVLGKDPEGVTVSVRSGDAALAGGMAAEIRSLAPDRRCFEATIQAGESAFAVWQRLKREHRRHRVALMPVLFDGDPAYRDARWGAFLFAPCKVLAYNRRLERHHLQLRSAIASLLFLGGVPLDRIFLRPWWLCPWKKDRSQAPDGILQRAGRQSDASRRRVAVLTPFFPYPLAHGGAVRMFNLLRETAEEYDVHLFAFHEEKGEPEWGPLPDFCTSITVVAKPRYREPRWSSWRPPEVCEYESPAMRRAWGAETFDVRIVEYTQLAEYGGDVLVEHDITFDLYAQVLAREGSLGAWWNWRRWHAFERRAWRRYARVVAMSAKDAAMIGSAKTRVIPNGVDLERFAPEGEIDGARMLFIGSFRHFPNIVAFRWLFDEVWPRVREAMPAAELVVVAGPDALLHWQTVTASLAPPQAPGVTLYEFVRDVRPLYHAANLVVVPTLVSAGTNVKVLEAMAMERAVLSTTSGCAGLGLGHAKEVWVADSAADFAAGALKLLSDTTLRRAIARAARAKAQGEFDWRALGERQRLMIRELIGGEVVIRPGEVADLAAIGEIQGSSGSAAQWAPHEYLGYTLRVAERAGAVVGFLVARATAPDEWEILNVAVAPEQRRRGVGAALILGLRSEAPGDYFLEVRESNGGARALYEKLGFRAAGKRPGYYENPPEDAVVMRLQS